MPADPSTATPVHRPGLTVGRVLAVATMVIIVIFWAAVFSGFFDKKNPDYLHDRAFVHRLDQRCRAAQHAIGRLPPARDSRTPIDRAGVVDRATDDLTAMVDDVTAEQPPSSADEARVVRLWLADWRVYLGDRREFARRLRTDPNARTLRLLIDRKPSAQNDAYDTVIKAFADVNNIPACEPPTDVE